MNQLMIKAPACGLPLVPGATFTGLLVYGNGGQFFQTTMPCGERVIYNAVEFGEILAARRTVPCLCGDGRHIVIQFTDPPGTA